MPVEVVDETAASSNAEGDATSKPAASQVSKSGAPASDEIEPPQSWLEIAAEKAATAVLSCLDREDDELCVMLVDDERMRELNLQWRGKDSTTDVLSFSQLDGEEMASPALMLGDVVVSVDVLRRQAADGGWTVEEELARLLLHGVLHLIGFDHEVEEDARVMRAEEGRVVELLAARGIACAWEGSEA